MRDSSVRSTTGRGGLNGGQEGVAAVAEDEGGGGADALERLSLAMTGVLQSKERAPDVSCKCVDCCGFNALLSVDGVVGAVEAVSGYTNLKII